MAGIRFHKLAAFVVLAASAAWMLTGEFSSVGSASQETAAEAAKAEQAPSAPARTVGVVDAPRQMHARAIRIAGHTEANKRAALATRAGGVVTNLPVKQGDQVKEGDLILSLDNAERVAAVDMARQVAAQREAEMKAAERLAQSGNMAKLQLDSARSALASAQSQLQAALAERDRTEVHAPFDGTVDKVSVEAGSAVQAGAAVATILSLDPILATGEISERDLRYVRIGDAADVRLVDGQAVEGRIRYISREASSTTRTFRVEVAIANPERRIPAGMTAEITLRAEPQDAVFLPRSVVTLSSNGDLGIRAVDKDSKVAFYPIDLIDDTPAGFVLGGIPADVRVIVAGQELVSEGDTVNAVAADQATLSKLASEAATGAR